MLMIMSVSPLHCYLWDTPTSLSLLWEQNRMFLLNIYTDNCPARFYNLQMYPFLVYFFPLAANSELFSYWLKSAVIPGHTKSPNTQELSSYSQKKLAFVLYLSCYQNKHRANLLHQSRSHSHMFVWGFINISQLVCMFPSSCSETNICSYLTNQILMKNTHAIEKIQGRVSSSAVRLVWRLLPVFMKEVSAWFLCLVGKPFPPAPAW